MQKKIVFWAVIAVAIWAACQSVHAETAPTARTVSFHVEVTGQGLPMLLIPGLDSAGEVWDSTVAHYKDHYQCHVLTLAGFAGQPAIDTPFLLTVREDLVAYIREKRLDRPVIVGHSLGGFLALWLAAEHPELVGKIVIIDSLPALGAIMNPEISPDDLASNARQMRDGMLKSSEAQRLQYQRASIQDMVSAPADVERIVAWGKISDPKTTANAMFELFSTDLRQEVSKIQAPTLVLGTWIAYEKYATQADIMQTFASQYKNLKDVQIELAPKARHFIMYDQPDWMFVEMDHFLAITKKA
jgi:pimeloyl-ACP methyl ester carboxylesterase